MTTLSPEQAELVAAATLHLDTPVEGFTPRTGSQFLRFLEENYENKSAYTTGRMSKLRSWLQNPNQKPWAEKGA